MNNPCTQPLQQPNFETIPVEETPYGTDVMFRQLIDPVLAEMPKDIELGFLIQDKWHQLVQAAMTYTHYDPDAPQEEQIPHTD